MSDNKRVLLVDDENDLLRASTLWMTSAGYDTLTACNGCEAVEKATEELPDAIVMDIRMPEKNGLTALAELKRQPCTKDIPVVMLSASLVDQECALDTGATCFLSKPYDGRHLINVVTSAISSHADRNS